VPGQNRNTNRHEKVRDVRRSGAQKILRRDLPREPFPAPPSPDPYLARKSRCENCRKSLPRSLRVNARFCCDACRKAAHRAREVAKLPKAHQRVVKDRQSVGQDRAALDIRGAIVREVSVHEARSVIEAFEPLPAVIRHCFGLFFDGRCGGAVVYGDEYAENLGVWDKYGFTGRIIALLRGACHAWAHPHSGSKLIRRSMALLPKQFQIITATVDRSQGEVGVIYQAAGFVYVRVITKGRRAAISLPDGRSISERQAYDLVGSRGVQALGRMGFNARSIPRRERYFAFRGSTSEQREARAAIAHLVKPYPMRA
jgi:hypothetical protein